MVTVYKNTSVIVKERMYDLKELCSYLSRNYIGDMKMRLYEYSDADYSKVWTAISLSYTKC